MEDDRNGRVDGRMDGWMGWDEMGWVEEAASARVGGRNLRWRRALM